MTDRYVYYFMRRHGSAGAGILSKLRATLEAIKGLGEALMESQIVVDHSEVDADGFVIGGFGGEPHSTGQHWPQIRSLELRAKSRDAEAADLDEQTDGAYKYMLELESRELRSQAKKLQQAAGAMV